MIIKVLAFGIAKDIFGNACIEIDLNGDLTVGHFKQALEQRYPRFKQLASYMVAVNDEYANSDLAINEHDEVAIIPPVSGG